MPFMAVNVLCALCIDDNVDDDDDDDSEIWIANKVTTKLWQAKRSDERENQEWSQRNIAWKQDGCDWRRRSTNHSICSISSCCELWNRFTRFGLSTFAENSGIKFRKNVIQNFNYPLHANIGRDNNRMPPEFLKVGDFWRMADLVAWKVRKNIGNCIDVSTNYCYIGWSEIGFLFQNTRYFQQSTLKCFLL